MTLWNVSRVCLCAALSIWTILNICQRGDARIPDGDLAGYIDEMTDHEHHKPAGKQDIKPFPKIIQDNGMFHFVLKDIALELVKLLEEEEGLVLSARQRDAIQDKIESIYERSKDHPALESDLIAFSPKKPDYHLYTPDSVLATHEQERKEKRSYFGPYAEVCESEEEWETMAFATLLNHTQAKVYRGFQFHMRQCTSDSENYSCLGIDSSLGSTGCQTTGTWVRALVCGRCNFELDSTCNDRCPNNRRDLFNWDWVYTPTCCKCAYQFGFGGHH